MKRISDANFYTEQYMDSILVEQRLIDSVVPSTEIEFFGQKYATPIVMPAFSHIKALKGRKLTGLEEYSIAAKEMDMLNFCGMMENDLFAKIVATGADTVRIVKPYADREKVKDQLCFAKEKGALAVGMDIDHIFGNGGFDICMGEEMTSQSLEQLKELVMLTDLPFVIKGVLSVSDALKAAEAGAKAIVVSHHHGRLPYAAPPMMVLPKIKEALKDKDVKIIVDCCIESGADIYKALALGADAVAIGRVMMKPLEEGGVEGVKALVKKLNDELIFMMAATGFADVASMDDSCLIIPPFMPHA